MQRNSYDEKVGLKILLYLFVLFVYEPLTTYFLFLPPLFGLVVYNTILHRSTVVDLFFWMFYLYLFEIDHNMPYFSLYFSLIVLSIFYKKMQLMINCRVCLIFLTVVFFYVLILIIGMVEIRFFVLELDDWHFCVKTLLLHALLDFILLVIVYER